MLYNQQVEADKRCVFDPHMQKKTKIFVDKPREEITPEEKRMLDDLTVYKPMFDIRSIQDYFDKNFSELSPDNAKKAQVKQLLKDLAKTAANENVGGNEIDRTILPIEIQDKFALLESVLDYKSKSDLLSWFVDSMRVQVLNHFDKEGTLKDMPDNEKMKLFSQIDAVQKNCKKELANLHIANKNGTLVEDSPVLASLRGEINALKSKIDIIQIEKQQLEMIKEHNSKVDDFT